MSNFSASEYKFHLHLAIQVHDVNHVQISYLFKQGMCPNRAFSFSLIFLITLKHWTGLVLSERNIQKKASSDFDFNNVQCTLALVNRALAKQRSCLWPTEKSWPLSPTSDSKPPSRWTTTSRWQRSSTARSWVSVCEPVGSRLSLTEPLNKNGSCGMMANLDLKY